MSTRITWEEAQKHLQRYYALENYDDALIERNVWATIMANARDVLCYDCTRRLHTHGYKSCRHCRETKLAYQRRQARGMS